MSPKVILSLFDHTGNWARPFADAGHEVVALDIKNEGDAGDVRNFSCHYLINELGIEWVDGIIAAPPCTDFAGSGAWTWKHKDKDGRTAASLELVLQVLRTVEFFQPDWWVIENPVGRLQRLLPQLGDPFIFDPCDYAGLLLDDATYPEFKRLRDLEKSGEAMTAGDIASVRKLNLYTKRTCLYGHFNRGRLRAWMRRVKPIRVCAQGSWTQRLGGKSETTKAARAATPSAFAQAFYRAHSDES